MAILYHGTSITNARKICHGNSNGFCPSTSGMLGPGVYFARRDKAERFAASASERGLGSGYCLIECEVDLGSCAQLNGNDTAGSWRRCYDSAHTTRTTESSNEEWCVKDTWRIDIRYYIDEDGERFSSVSDMDDSVRRCAMTHSFHDSLPRIVRGRPGYGLFASDCPGDRYIAVPRVSVEFIPGQRGYFEPPIVFSSPGPYCGPNPFGFGGGFYFG